ncbi:hypothetical protein PYW07_000611 [Mythimna separata]|uniref:GYF domain-containing protein n=1 Tax=Mythimna separata TaxID=271217 RepID=A0AAD7Z450_MYTSE|nr:hypothetical protein PYW07_000611 [Mythimna separata]
MGDRNNPIKFGPEWLRNMSRERSAGRSNSQNASSNPGTSASGSSTGGGTATGSASAQSNNNSNNGPKVLLAKLRYGREEMLALYDRNAEAPSELKSIDTLYQPRGKQPVALNNTFEDDVRDNLRSAPLLGGMTSGDRFMLGRGIGRGAGSDGRGRARGSYIRQPSMGRGAPWHVGSPRMPAYNVGQDDETSPGRPWTNNSLSNPNRNSGDQTDWTTKMFRNKRQGNNTNWRSPQTRDDGEEWRSSEPGRSRQLEKWDRDWGDRPSGDKPQSSWNNRRNWGGDNQNNEENLPEWAVESAECGGTFDSSGAFHGYSNDDSNLPKHQDGAYSLTRSHTHGSFPRPKVMEEGSDEWWASEKAKKLSPKRFDASDLKFKKQPGIGIADASTSSTNNKSTTSNDDSLQDIPEKTENDSASALEPAETSTAGQEEASDERGNFQSVIINSNNSLRQKHQHLVPAMNEASGKSMHNINAMKNMQSDMDHISLKSPEELLVDNIFSMSLDDKEMHSTPSSNSFSNSAMSSALASAASGMPQNQSMQMTMSNSGMPNHGMNMEMHLNNQNMQAPVIQPVHHSPGMQPVVINAGGMQQGLPSGMQSGLHIPGMPVPMQPGMQNPGYPSVAMQNVPGMPTGGMQNMPGMQSGGMQNIPGMQTPRVQTPGMQPVMQNVGITNSALNASLGLPIGPNMGQPFQGMPQQVMPNNSPLSSSGMGVMGSSSMQGTGNMPSFQSSGAIPGMSNNVGNASLFLGQNSNNTSMSAANDMPMTNHSGHMMQLQGMQGSQGPFGNSMYGNNGMPNANLLDQWYYEDPERNIQGPFSSKDMYNWYRAGFFSPSLMLRRACESIMRPLGTYGPVVPFAQMDNMMNSYPLSGGFDRPQGSHENMMNAQATLTLDDSLWGQGPSSSADLMWMQQSRTRSEARVNNLPIFFWDQQPSTINTNSLLPEDITKEMKTEDQILAQLRATQNIGQPSQPFIVSDLQGPSAATPKPDDCYAPNVSATPNMEELHKLIQTETLTGHASHGGHASVPSMSSAASVASIPEPDIVEPQPVAQKPAKLEQSASETSVAKPSTQAKAAAEPKPTKQAKEAEKTAKNKENNNTKNKGKKAKEEKKEEVAEVKVKEEEVKAEKRSQETSPSKSKKEDKSNKKDIEKEKKEWIKEGFTIVKGPEKSASKDSKKKAEEARVADEAERKRKEEEKLATDEEKKKKQAEEIAKKQQELQTQQQQRQATELIVKKAPWSTVTNQNMQATNKDGLTLAEIQRLEREKKLEQMKEQQQMMQIIAQQQAAALAREQEMQAGLGWAKKKASTNQSQGQSLAEIQAEARKQQLSAAVAAAAKAMEEVEVAPPPQTNHAPWANPTHNGVGGFWDTQQSNSSKNEKHEAQKSAEPAKTKKKPTFTAPLKKDTSPAVEFESWCAGVLASWSSKIDVPTFVNFLRDIESPYEVKDYVKCYLGESKETNDFSRQFLERRSKLLRVGMVTPSDDLCSPAIAVNPRTVSGSDYQEVKGKGKKTKKNKMLKVDVRILGFSVTASEDRINVGDIDTV